MKGFGKRLKAAMKDKGMSQKEMARRCAITEPTMCRYANGRTFPRLGMIRHMADVLEVSADYLINGSGDTDRKGRKKRFYSIADSEGETVTRGISQDVLEDVMAILFGDNPDATFSVSLDKSSKEA